LLTFKDDRVIQRLGTEFIPVTANTQELQWRRSPTQAFFLKAVAGTQSETLSKEMDRSQDPQGMYILGADGTSYGFINDHDPADVLRFMDRGLRGFRAQPPRPAVISDAEVAAPWTVRPPEGGAVVRVFSRIRPLPEKVWGLNRGVGRDFLWLYPEDVQGLVAGSGGAGPAAAGAPARLPEALLARIARFHLVDGVRGTPDMWGAGEVRRQAFQAKVLRQVGHVRTLALRGEFAMRGTRRSAVGARERVEQGYTGVLEAEIDLDVSAGRLLRFRALGEGDAWGEGTYTPYPPPGRFRLLIAMVEAAPADEIARTVPPEAVATHNGDGPYHRAAR
jgi:hypothetical protein